jgi:formylglycine-generating enzyme required for sulfatase activity
MHRSLQISLGGGVLAAALFVLSFPRVTENSYAADDPSVKAANHKAYVETIPGSTVKFEMVPIPGGTFVMGSPSGEPGRGEDEGPQHPVTIRPFWMGKTEVTWDEFDRYRKERAVEFPEQNEERLQKDPDAITGPTKPYVDETWGHGREGHPVIGITHHAAMEYCRWLSNKTGKVYRLPTEAEWEYAARAGTRTAYFFGDDPKQLGDYAWFKDNSEDPDTMARITHEVGKKKPNPWGLYDIYGNVTEWCLDTYKKDYYASFPTDRPTLSPVLIPNGDRFPHVARGGSWADPAPMCRSAARRTSTKKWIKRDPQRPQSIWWLTDAEFVGFRLARAVEEQDNLKGLRSKTTRDSK